MYLTNLVYNVPLVHKVVIVNEKGGVMGHLRVAIEPVTHGQFFILLELSLLSRRIKMGLFLSRFENFSIFVMWKTVFPETFPCIAAIKNLFQKNCRNDERIKES